MDDVIQAPQLLDDLFRRGTELLIRHLPLVWEGRAREQAQPQVRAAYYPDVGARLCRAMAGRTAMTSTAGVQESRTAAFPILAKRGRPSIAWR